MQTIHSNKAVQMDLNETHKPKHRQKEVNKDDQQQAKKATRVMSFSTEDWVKKGPRRRNLLTLDLCTPIDFGAL